MGAHIQRLSHLLGDLLWPKPDGGLPLPGRKPGEPVEHSLSIQDSILYRAGRVTQEGEKCCPFMTEHIPVPLHQELCKLKVWFVYTEEDIKKTSESTGIYLLSPGTVLGWTERQITKNHSSLCCFEPQSPQGLKRHVLQIVA